VRRIIAFGKAVAAIQVEGRRVEGHVCDIRGAQAVKALVTAVTATAPLDVAHNNVGVYRGGGAVWRIQ
jgi:NAD(P)-dependent dehydrogenase (short-subunit alcohol dehydrogenase family)